MIGLRSAGKGVQHRCRSLEGKDQQQRHQDASSQAEKHGRSVHSGLDEIK
jgi:hypothetical protein